MAADGLGRPVRIILTGGQRGDATQAQALIDGFAPRRVLADKADSAQRAGGAGGAGAWRLPRRRPVAMDRVRACHGADPR